MVPLDSTLQGREEPFEHVRSYLHEHEFALGGNWDYEHGSFDRYLDEGHKVWLRIPFEVTSGVLDGDTDSTDAFVRIGTPFVLKHVYNEGLDQEAQARTYGALMDQFQEPLDKDGTVEDKWVDRAASLLREIESGFTTP
ncbi:hypothetical protein QJ48_35120 [Paenibacillus sp. A3]|uniref:YugN family protein n=1 Tax=Paenibacillus sp. A3 TaxID=1337054 RepID=UPI0006D59796|nr:YugN family protein [Paenibacillus sp. A3]KPV55076.1 hypothetical protein QJ48_35120 [Paenibacillus sp. A3]